MSASKIEWTSHTWNPVTGCTKISPGCKHCYAEAMAHRLQVMGAPDYAQGFAVTLHEDRLGQPLARKTPTVYFVGSMADLFHEAVPDVFLERILAILHRTPRHTYLLLTKRAERLAAFFTAHPAPAQVWLGVTVEDRCHGLPRIEHLRRIPARIRFLCVEPLLEDLGPLDLSGIHWVIVGGESTPAARPMQPAWARAVRDQCVAAGVPFLFKQWGTWGADGVRRHKKANGRCLDGRAWDERPKVSRTLFE